MAAPKSSLAITHPQPAPKPTNPTAAAAQRQSNQAWVDPAHTMSVMPASTAALKLLTALQNHDARSQGENHEPIPMRSPQLAPSPQAGNPSMPTWPGQLCLRPTLSQCRFMSSTESAPLLPPSPYFGKRVTQSPIMWGQSTATSESHLSPPKAHAAPPVTLEMLDPFQGCCKALAAHPKHCACATRAAEPQAGCPR
jgi:hypothetical protein